MPTMTTQTAFLSLVLVIFVALLTYVFRAFVRTRRGLSLRPLPGYLAVPRLQGRAIETGQELHVSLGTAGIGGADTAATLAGLAVLETVTDEAAASDSPPTITVSDPTALVLAQDALRRSYTRQHNTSAYDPRSVRFAAAAPIPYAAAVMDIVAHEETAASIMIGAFGPEAALIAEESARQGVMQIVGTSNVTTLPLVYPSADHLLVGEEMFVSGAYVGADPTRVSGVVVQDVLRWLVVLAILLGAFLKALPG